MLNSESRMMEGSTVEGIKAGGERVRVKGEASGTEERGTQ